MYKFAGFDECINEQSLMLMRERNHWGDIERCGVEHRAFWYRMCIVYARESLINQFKTEQHEPIRGTSEMSNKHSSTLMLRWNNEYIYIYVRYRSAFAHIYSPIR